MNAQAGLGVVVSSVDAARPANATAVWSRLESSKRRVAEDPPWERGVRLSPNVADGITLT